MKKWLSLMCTAVLLTGILGGCGSGKAENSGAETTAAKTAEATQAASSQAEKDKEFVFAYSVMSYENPYFISVVNGFEAKCKELGTKSFIVDAKYDVAKQVSDIENLIEQGVDAILISPIDDKAITQVVEKAKEKGIIVLGTAQPVSNSYANYIVNEYEYGKVIGSNAGNWIKDKLNGEAEVAIISQDNVEAVIQRGNGVEDAIKEIAPNAKIVARQAGDTPEKGMQIIEGVLQQYPNLKVVVGVNDSGAIGGYEAVKALGKATDDFFVGGADATAEAIAKMKEENSVYRATVDIFPYQTGMNCAEGMMRYLKNGTPDETETFYFDMSPVLQDDVLSGKYVPQN